MNYYFHLQYKRLNRKIQEIGLPPILGYLSAAIAFLAFSNYLFYKTIHAKWLYLFFYVLIVLQLGEGTKTNWLHALFPKSDYLKIRVIENSLFALPFVLYLLYEQAYFIIGILLITAILFAFLRTNQSLNIVLPTPFKKLPFEWIVGFRKSFLFILPIYFLLYKGWEVGNYNLGLATIGGLFLVGISFYFQPESRYFVWIFSSDTSSFLWDKIKIALLGVSILIFPAIIIMLIGFPIQLIPLAITLLLGYLFLVATVLAKYSAFPNEWRLPQILLMGLCFSFPPLLFVVIPIFYNQARKRLSTLLKW